MFEGLRRHSSSFAMLLLVASVAMVFGVSWGPGTSQASCSRESLRVNFVARVRTRTLVDADYVSARKFASQMVPQNATENPAIEIALRQGVLDGLIERELLAQEAERLGVRVTDEMVNEQFRACRFYFSVGTSSESVMRRSGPVEFPRTLCGTATEFQYPQFERSVRRLFGRTVSDLRESMKREMLADRMREMIRASVSISDEEMWQEYQRTHDQMAVKYVRFNLAFYRNLVRDDDAAAVDTWARAHAEDVNREWQRRRESLQHLPRQIRVRHILVKFPDDATDAQRAEVQARAQAIHAQIVAGGDFVRLARLYSEDDGSWRAGGELGWSQPDRYVAEFSAAAAALQPNGISAPVRTQFGYHVLQLLGTREGDVAEADGKREIARTLFREARAAELAREAANAALPRIRAGAIDAVAREINTAALREFYRGETPAPAPLAGGISLAVVERTDLGAPALVESEAFSRNGNVASDVGNNEQLTSIAFTLDEQHPLVGSALKVGDDYFVLRFKEGSRVRATREEFARQRSELMRTTYGSMLAVRQNLALVRYLSRARQVAERERAVEVGNSPRLRAQAADDQN
jgi:peptidyl-prolyl cis-trans isomerase D